MDFPSVIDGIADGGARQSFPRVGSWLKDVSIMTKNLENDDLATAIEVPSQLLQRRVIEGTVLIPLFNHGAYIRASLGAIVAAWCPGYELLLIDDASRDDGFAEALDVLAAHPEIPTTLMRSEKNLGHGLLADALKLARGRFLVQADSDDLMMPDRLSRIAERFRSDPRCRLVTSNAVKISPEGIPIGLYDTFWNDEIFDDSRSAADQEGDTRWLGATAAYHRDVFDLFPALDTGLFPYGLDLATPLRALLLGTHHYIALPLVRWRLHAHNHHREAGHYSPRISDRQRYQAFSMMVLAQKLRDVTFAEHNKLRPELGPTAKAAHDFFFEKFDLWSRLFTEGLVAPATLPSDPPAAGFMPVVPPIPTLSVGDRLSFMDGEFAGEIARHWNGFHAPETWGCWLHRCAVMTLRLIAEAPAVMIFALKGHPFSEDQRVSIQLGAAGWTSVVLEPSVETTIRIAVPPDAGRGLLSIVIVAHDAAIPRECSNDRTDMRLLGAGLFSMSVDTA